MVQWARRPASTHPLADSWKRMQPQRAVRRALKTPRAPIRWRFPFLFLSAHPPIFFTFHFSFLFVFFLDSTRQCLFCEVVHRVV